MWRYLCHILKLFQQRETNKGQNDLLHSICFPSQACYHPMSYPGAQQYDLPKLTSVWPLPNAKSPSSSIQQWTHDIPSFFWWWVFWLVASWLQWMDWITKVVIFCPFYHMYKYDTDLSFINITIHQKLLLLT